MKLCIIQCYLYLSHARWRNFAWYLLWLSTTERKNIVKLLTISHSRQFQLFSTDLPSNFWKIAWLLGNTKTTVSSRFIRLSFPSKNRPPRENFLTGNYLIVCTIKKGNNRYLWSGGKTFKPCSARTIIFQRKHLKYLVIFFTQCTLFFQYVCFFILPVCLPCVTCGKYVTRIHAVSWHITRQTLVPLCLFTWLVYVRTYCVPTATLNQKKRSRLPYLGDAKLIIDSSKRLLPSPHEFSRYIFYWIAFFAFITFDYRYNFYSRIS